MNKSISIVFSVLVIGSVLAIGIQSVLAISPLPCPSCAKDFAPGQEKQFAEDSDFESKSAKQFAPGQEKAGIVPGPCPSCNSASEFAPGQEKKQFDGDMGQ